MFTVITDLKAATNMAGHFQEYFGGMATLKQGCVMAQTHNKAAWNCYQKVADMVLEIDHDKGNDDCFDAVAVIVPDFGC